MKVLKGIIIGTILVFSIGVVVFLGLSLYAYNNLKYYSVYYAQQIPHKEGTEPDLVMLIENMGSIYTPKIEGIRYDDGRNFIENSTNMIGKPTNFSEFDGGYSYRDQNDVAYKFGKNFSLEWAMNKKYEKIDLTTIDEKKIKQGIRETVQPVLDVQSKPFINLQWLFNKMYQDRFN